MGIPILLLASLLLGGDPAAEKLAAFRTRTLKIPVQFRPEMRSQISEVRLLESTDQGRTWGQRAVIPPTQSEFNVSFDNDGVYWFTISIVDKDGRQEPSDPSKAPVGLKVLIDTKRPEVTLTAARQGEAVVVDWRIQEDHPKLATLKLEYHTADMPAGQWQPVKIDPQLTGRIVLSPIGPGALSLRLEIHDEAENVGVGQAEVPPTLGPQGTALPTPPPVPPPSDGGSGSPFPATPAGLVRDQSKSQHDQVDAQPFIGGTVAPPPSAAGGRSGEVVATTGAQNPPLGPPTVPPSNTPRGDGPRAEYINTTRINVNYEVDKIGASGIGSVELFVTRDEGSTWQRLTSETPAPTAQPGPRTITAELPGEGRYGLYLIVRSGVGLGKQAPRNGERPQMRVEVDLTTPEGSLYKPQPAPGQRDAVIVRWLAKDANLGDKPIRLEWAERKGGPWQLIGEGDLANTGQYLWKLPSNIPGRIFMRMSITDLAKNVGIAESPEPETIDLNEPEAKIIGLGR
jgi:hypothetical protein